MRMCCQMIATEFLSKSVWCQVQRPLSTDIVDQEKRPLLYSQLKTRMEA